jgi:hypothetical protein
MIQNLSRIGGKPPLDPALMVTLEQLFPHIQILGDRWWLFGSAAMALHGAGPIAVRDVDLLVSRADAPLLLGRLGLPLAPGAPSERFRSAVFATWTEPPLDVEILAGFRARVGEGWQEVRPRTRQPAALPFGTVYMPDVPELIGLCRMFGRPKDRERERLLRALIRP